MSKIPLVRTSRDGDQFHYTWAARRCLLLLSPDADLEAITIEGISPLETESNDRITAGEEIIDVAEYYGSEIKEHATLIRYIQNKHSTVRTDKPWMPSEMKKTIEGFARWYVHLKRSAGMKNLKNKLEFCFISNRPIAQNFLNTINIIAQGAPDTASEGFTKLKEYTKFSTVELINFCKMLRLEGNHKGLWDQQNLLAQDLRYYSAGIDFEGPAQLKELVTQKALSRCTANPVITKIDVLRALKVEEDDLFPATCLIENIEGVIPREQEPDFYHKIMQAKNAPVIIHAAGGVGKSIIALRIGLGMPPGSVSIIYDCFGNGQYRSASHFRHRQKDALVQIANELAAKGLCHPLIPTSHVGPSDYMKPFLYRLQQSIDSLRSKSPEALLCIIIDAADNAQIAAEDNGEARSFVRDLLREQFPEGVRLIALCRSHRQAYLDPPPEAIRLELLSFSRNETAMYLRKVFPDASEQDVDEFHRLSSQNPRIQSWALSEKKPLNEMLRGLGPNPTTVEDTLGGILNKGIEKLRDTVGYVEKKQIDSICEGLAALRPLIPIPVLASISGVDEVAIKSFAYDLGHPLLVAGDSLQFFDEPVETWFRGKFKPTEKKLAAFVATLKPLAAGSSYIASILPQLMLEAGQIEEIVTLALSSDALPDAAPIEKREIELQRFQFALKACLRTKRYFDAVKLALMAGAESAGEERQRKLLQSNTDLAAIFLTSNRLEELVSRKTFSSTWPGSHHAYEAALLSGTSELVGGARSSLRIALEWLRNWSQLSDAEQGWVQVSKEDIVELTTAFFNIHGADVCAKELRKWQPREVSFSVGRALAKRFVDNCRYQDLEKLALAAEDDLYLILAITLELREVNRTPPKSVVKRAVRLALNPQNKFKDDFPMDIEGTPIRAVTALVEAAHLCTDDSKENLISLLTCSLPESPPRGISSRFSRERFAILRAYALRAALCNCSLELIDLANVELRKELETPEPNSESQDLREFKERVGSILPWHCLWASVFVGQTLPRDLTRAIDDTRAKSTEAKDIYYPEDSFTSNEIARVWFDTLIVAECDNEFPSVKLVDGFDDWISKRKYPLYPVTLTHLARLAARSSFLNKNSLQFAVQAVELFKDTHENAESKSDTYVALARAVLALSPSDASAYFNQAVKVASKIGDENLARWNALLELANHPTSTDSPDPALAYQFARCAELSYEYQNDYFNWKAIVESICALCAKSALSILTRWRDRNFGTPGQLLSIAINNLVAQGNFNPKVALSLTGFRTDGWNEPLLLKSFLSTCVDKEEKKCAVDFTYRQMTLNQQDSKKWNQLKGIFVEHDMDYSGIDQRISFFGLEESTFRSSEITSMTMSPESESARDWDLLFSEINLSLPNGIVKAYQRFKDYGPPYAYAAFFDEAFLRVPVGNEAEFINTCAEVPNFSLHELDIFLKRLPMNWRKGPAAQSALYQALKKICRRFCLGITRSRYSKMFPLSDACCLCGVPEEEIVDVVIKAVSETTEVVGSDHLFYLAGFLSSKLTEKEARDALSFGLRFFDPLLTDTDGDGSWKPTLAPPETIEGSIAGYIWGCLASPRANVRWEAAHVVRTLCLLGQEAVLKDLILLAEGLPADAFHDGHLYFYTLHARQWLLIGLARAAKESPHAVVPHATFLIKQALDSEPHILIREFAKRALLALLDAGLLRTHSDLVQRLATINISKFPVLDAKSSQYCSDEKDDPVGITAENNEDRFSFGLDFGPYWLAPLGVCFAKSQINIEREVQRVILEDWGISGFNRWDKDARHRLNIFKNMETMHSHGSYPRVDELRFYLSYHAMMLVAGKLLDTTPVLKEADDSEDKFLKWLRNHDLCLQDGSWLADRRDPVPLERPLWKNEEELRDWPQSITKSDFDRNLQTSDGRINLWGSWSWVSGQREESIRVYSALVSPDRSFALMRALQSVDNPWDYRIPDANDDLQIDYGGFQLKGWIIADHSYEGDIEKNDPWAGAISYPPPIPAVFVTDLMKLNHDIECRRWYIHGANQVDVGWAQIWGSFSESGAEGEKQESGLRFQASLEFIVQVLKKLEMNLILDVEIERRYGYPRWGRGNNDGYIPPSARIYLIRPDGRISTL